MPRARLRLLGGFEFADKTGAVVALTSRKGRSLLAYLALNPDRRHDRGELAALLWGDRGETQARDSLKQCLLSLRKAIGASNRAIFVQFLAESLCVTLISGAAGAALGSLLVFALARMTVATNSVLITPILVPGILAGIFVSVVVIGVVSGLLPAIRASRIEPAISLRA